MILLYIEEALKKTQIDVEMAIKNTISPIITQINEKTSEEKKAEELKLVLKNTIEPMLSQMKMNQHAPYYYPNLPPRLMYNEDRFSEVRESGHPPPAQLPVNESTREHPPARGNGRGRNR